MEMSVRTRILDMLPALIVFAVVAACSTYLLVVYVAHEPLVVPPPEQGTYQPPQPGDSGTP